VKSKPLEEIRADLDRIPMKRKYKSKGLLIQVHPWKKKKILGIIDWVGSFGVAKACL